MFVGTGFKTLEILKKNVPLNRLKAVTIKKFHSQLMCHKWLILQFSGLELWYVLLHKSSDFENKHDCPTAIIANREVKRSLDTSDVYDIRLFHNNHCLFTVNWRRKST
jgi:hypothetical protein